MHFDTLREPLQGSPVPGPEKTARKDQAIAQIAQYNSLKVPATIQDTANGAVLIASDRARMVTRTVVNATAGAALD